MIVLVFDNSTKFPFATFLDDLLLHVRRFAEIDIAQRIVGFRRRLSETEDGDWRAGRNGISGNGQRGELLRQGGSGGSLRDEWCRADGKNEKVGGKGTGKDGVDWEGFYGTIL